MSKSLGNILDPLEIIKHYGVDQLRYYLIKEVSLGNDGSISLNNLKNCINNDLVNNFEIYVKEYFLLLKKIAIQKLQNLISLIKKTRI